MRAALPREHGLWCWAGAPLLGALLLAPHLSTLVGAGALLLLLGAGNAARRRAWGPTAVCGALALAGAIALLPALGTPGGSVAWAISFAGLAGLGGLALGLAGPALTRGPTPRRPAGPDGGPVDRPGDPGLVTGMEIGTIAVLAGAGAGLAVAVGASATAAGLVALCTVTWEVTGLWWVRGQLAKVLPGRTHWSRGPVAVAALSTVLAVAAVGAGHPALALVPGLYALRVLLTRPVSTARDARRIGLGEAAWAGVAVALAVLAVG